MSEKTVRNLKNYELIEEGYIEELDSTAYYLIHKKTKAEVLYIDSDDEIMTFGIGFRTPPVDSTGVAHIVEHCVLSGSRKYRTKEPFMDLVNSSLQTFLNAMTFPDKTIYPVATRNDKDFMNLMDVYLDAVFFPRMYEQKEIFMQEGWHLELEDKDGELKYNGVVYNEMRGAYSDPDSQVQEQLAHQLHPGSTYAHDSGGDPHEIPNLKYEDFLDFHKRYYHPSNSYIFLNGDLDVEKILNYIDEEYLSKFEYKEPNSEIIMNESFTEPKFVETYHSVGIDEETEEKNYLVVGVDIGKSISPLSSHMEDWIRDILLDSDSSILMEPLLESGIGTDYFTMGSASYPMDIYIVAKGAKEEDLDRFVEIVNREIKKAVEEGIDKDLIEATINKYEFKAKELGIHKGIMLYIFALRGWLYGVSPVKALLVNDIFNTLKEKIRSGYLEDFLQKEILDNPNRIYLISKPKPGMFAEKDKIQKKKLAEYKESLSDEEIEKIIQETKDLFEYQLREDTKEDKDTIPRLKLEDLSSGVVELNTHEEIINGNPMLYTEEFTNGITYLDMAFNLKNLNNEEIPYSRIIIDLIGSLDTENYSYKDLNNAIDMHTGGINFGASAYKEYDSDYCYVVSTIRGRVLPEKIDKFTELIEEMLLRTKFEDKKRIRDLMVMNRETKESIIEQSGHSVISTEVRSMMSDYIDLQNLLGGRKSLFFLRDAIAEFDEDPDAFLEKLTRIYKKIYNKEVGISVAGEREQYEKLKDWTLELREKLSEVKESLNYKRDQIHSIALRKASNVVYVSDGFDYTKYGYEYDGSMSVLAKILSGEYLHTNIRAKGGAYGSGIAINQNGHVVTFSYRDPNLDRTFQVYDNIPEYLSKLELSNEDLTNYIIATMNRFDPPIDSSQYSGIALGRYFTHLSSEVISEMKDQAIATTPEKIREYGEMFEKASGKKYYGVLGSSDLIDQSEREYEVEEKI